jgi:putative nucleotidyltransferase with HDIG domain
MALPMPIPREAPRVGSRLAPHMSGLKHEENSNAAAEQSVGGSVLVVDDDPAAAKLVSLYLDGTPFRCTTAQNAAEALRLMEVERFAAVISDFGMPGMSGLELLRQTKRRFPHTAFILATGVDDLGVAVESMRCGADDYLVKPLHDQAVLASLERAVRKQNLELQLQNYREKLESLVGERTQQLSQAMKALQDSYEETLQALGRAIDLRDGETAGHSWRVCRYSLKIAAVIRFSENECQNLARAAYLHDIGKLGVPDKILLKPGALSKQEWTVMRQHVEIGFNLLKAIPFLTEAAEIVFAHHEHFDGSGYPRGLSGGRIPLGARIFSVADAFDAITTDRVYRPAASMLAAREIILRRAGTQFDPAIVEAFSRMPLACWEEIANDRRHLPLADSVFSKITP